MVRKEGLLSGVRHRGLPSGEGDRNSKIERE